MNQIIVFLSLLAFTNLLSVRCQFFFDPSEDVGSSPRSSPQSSSPSFPQFSGFNNVPHLRILAGDPQNPSVTRISRFDFPQDGRPPSDRSNGFSDLSGNFLEGPGPNQFSRPNPLNPFAGFLRPGLGGNQNGPSEFTPSSSFPRFPSSQPSQPFFQPPTNPFRPSQPSNSLNSLNSFNSLQPQPQLQPQSQPRPPQFVAAPPLRPPQFSSTPAQRPPQFVPAQTPPTSGGPLFVTPPPRPQSFPQSRPQSDPGILFVTPPPRSEILPRTTNSDFGANEFRFSGPRPPIPPPSQTGREERPSLLISFQNQNRNIQPTSGVRPFLNPATIRQPPSTSSVSSSSRPSLSSGVEYAEDEGGVSNEQPERRPVDTGFRTARVQARPAFEPSFFGFGNSPASPNDLLINLYGLNANRTSPAVPSSFRPPARSFFSEPAPPSSGSGRNTGSPFEFEFPLLNQFARDNNIQIHGHSPNSLRTIRPPPSSNTLVAIPLGTPPDSVAVAFGLQPPPSSAPVNTSSLTALKDVILAQQFARLQANRESRPTIGSDQPVSIGEERATTERPGARVPTYYQPTPPRATQQPPRNNIEYVQPVARSRPTYRQPSVEATTRRPPYPEDAGVPERANVVPVPNTIEGNAGIEHYGLPVGHFPDLARLPKNQSSSVSINRPPVVVTAAPPLPTAAYRPPSPPPAVVQPAIRPLPPSFSYLEPSEVTTPRPTSPPYDRRPLTNQPQYGRFRPAPVSRTPYAPEFRRAVAVPAQGEPVTSEPVTQPPATTRRPSFRRPSYEYRPATRRPVATTQAPPANTESGNDVNDLGYGRSLRGPQTPPGDTGRPQPVRGFVRPDGRTVPNVGPNVRVVAVRRSRQNATAIQRTGTGPSGRPFRVALRQPATTSLATTASTLPSTTVKPQVAFNASNIPNSGRLPADTDGDGIPGHAGKDYPSLLNIPKTSFSCANMPTNGYYADTEAQCQVVHLCQFGGTQDSFLCPNGTIFNQQRFSCQWWFEVDCASAPKYYGLNDNFHREPNSGNEPPVDSVRRGSRRN